MAKILVVDDSSSVRESARQALEAAGHEVLTEGNAILLAVHMHREKLDLVLLDVSLPLVTGDSSLKGLRPEDLENTTVLLYSSLGRDELKVLVEKSGARGYILKSADPTDLVRQVDGWLTQAHSPPPRSAVQK